MNECTHSYDQIIWVGKDNKVYSRCTNCDTIFNLTCSYDSDNFKTTAKPTNHDKKFFNITELDGGIYLYERKLPKM